MRTNRIINIVIVFQIALIVFFGYRLNLKRNNILGTQANISPIKKETVQQAPSEELKYFYELLPNQVATWSADFLKKPITNIYNNDGLNDIKNYSVEKQPNAYRIITLGDSYTYGHFVKTENNWTELLEDKLNEKKICKNIDKFEVINLGVPGYDMTYEVEKYYRTGQKYNPNLIIWMLDDLNRINEIRVPLINECTNNKDHLSKKVIRCKEIASTSEMTEIGMSGILKKQTEAVSRLISMYNNPIFLIDYYNNHQDIINNLTNSTIFNELATNKYLYKDYSKLKLTFPDTHPNELGHKLISNIIYEQLFKMNQIPCEPIE